MHTHTLRLDIKAFSVCCLGAYVCKSTYTRPYSLTCPGEAFSNTGQSFINVQSVQKSYRVADPDLYVFGPPGPGSVSQRYGSGSGSFYHQAKNVRKTLIATLMTLYL